MVKMVTHIEAQNFESSLKNLQSSEVTGIFGQAKLHLPQSQVSVREGKTFHYKVLSKLYRNGELNLLVI